MVIEPRTDSHTVCPSHLPLPRRRQGRREAAEACRSHQFARVPPSNKDPCPPQCHQQLPEFSFELGEVDPTFQEVNRLAHNGDAENEQYPTVETY